MNGAKDGATGGAGGRSPQKLIEPPAGNTHFQLTASFWKFLKISRYKISDHGF